MDWFTSLIKMAGVSFPVSAPFVQLLSELESKELETRIRKLEDPVSHLHPDVPELSELLYEELKTTNDSHVELTDELYAKFSRPLAALEAENMIVGGHTMSKRYYAGITITDPTYIMYMCLLFENTDKMEILYQKIDACPIGESLKGEEIQKTLDLPTPVIKAAFDIFEAKGYGICSREQSSCLYIGKA